MMKLLLLQLCDSLPATTTMLPSCTVCLSWHLHYLLHFANSSSSGSMVSKPSGTLIWINGIKKIFYYVDGKESRHIQTLLAKKSSTMWMGRSQDTYKLFWQKIFYYVDGKESRHIQTLLAKNLLLRGWEGVKTHTNSSGKKSSTTWIKSSTTWMGRSQDTYKLFWQKIFYYVDGKESRHIQTLLAKKSSGTNKFL